MHRSFAAGEEIAGYRVESFIARGGMAVVYRARDVQLDRRVALKLLAPELTEDDNFRQRFMRESRLAASLDHPHIIPIYRAGQFEDLLYLSMRYVEGADLGGLLTREGPLRAEQAVVMFDQLAGALDAAHAHGLVHRDVKPDNVLVCTDAGRRDFPHLYLTDFGLTKRVESLSELTMKGQFLGTVDYVAPEQITGQTVDPRTDVYALGCVLYEALTGRRPFDREADAAVIYAHLSEPPPSVTASRQDLPREVDRIVATAMAKRPGDRYTTCHDLVADLRAAVGEPIEPIRSAVPGGSPAPSVPPPASRPTQLRTAPPGALPDEIRGSLESPHVHLRLGAVAALGEWLVKGDPARAVAARQALEQVAESDVPRVAARAHALLGNALAPTKIEPRLVPEAEYPAIAYQPHNGASQVRAVVNTPESAPARVRRRPLIIIAVVAALAVVGTLAAIVLQNTEPLLVDEFHTQEYGWEGEGPGAGYVNDAYRIDLEPGTSETARGTTSVPRNASSVYPSAPSDIRVEVDARSLSPLDNSSGYGVICRLNEDAGNRYQFAIGEGGENTVRITRFLGGRSQHLTTRLVGSLHATGTNKIQAECVNEGDAEQGRVHLAFRLNGQLVAEYRDPEPLPDGTVGIRVFASGRNSIQVEFDNFVVTRV